MESAPEEEPISLEDTLGSLKRNAKAVDVYFQQARSKFKSFHQKLAHESSGLSETPLQPKTRMMKWLTDRGLPEQSSFMDFFEVFLDEHKKEYRLDLSKRSICLNLDACILFGYKGPNPTVTLYDLLEKIHILYY